MQKKSFFEELTMPNFYSNRNDFGTFICVCIKMYIVNDLQKFF